MMCRFIAYIGKPIILDELLYQPENSLVHQSYKAQERREPLNGDGFGLGFYVREIDPTPALFVSTTPAWNNRNLRYNARKIRSNCIFAHVRAASFGNVSEVNCHPFHYKTLLLMHNGEIGGFRTIKRALRRTLSDEMYDWIQGETDSEHFFALFLHHLFESGNDDTCEPDAFIAALRASFLAVQELQREHNVRAPSFLNLAITNGRCVVATRYTLGASRTAATLYHSEGSRFECRDGVCRMVRADPGERSILIVSEKLTAYRQDWREVPKNHCVVVKDDLSVTLKPISL